MRRKRLLTFSLMVFLLIGAGVYFAIGNNGSFLTLASPSDTSEEVAEEGTQGDDSLGNVEDQAVAQKKEEFTILERDQERFDALLEVKEKEVTPVTPTRVQIPALDVDATITNVGILENGEMEVPENTEEVGWFEPGVKPGQIGNAVLAGHVDSYEGPAIFFYLKDLEPGDEVIVTEEGADPLTFVVKELVSYPTDGAPIEEIFGRSDKRNLNLITCTGSFNHDSGAYPDRLVVYTELKVDEEEVLNYVPTTPTNVELSGNLLKWHAVRDPEVIGYRVYQELEDGTVDYVDSVSYYERKSLVVDDLDATYFVTAVSYDEKESERATFEEAGAE